MRVLTHHQLSGLYVAWESFLYLQLSTSHFPVFSSWTYSTIWSRGKKLDLESEKEDMFPDWVSPTAWHGVLGTSIELTFLIEIPG